MLSVIAIGSEVFGSCGWEIEVSVEIKNGDGLLCCGWKCLGFILAGNRLNICGGWERWCQVLEGILGALGVVEELKSPCGSRGFGR